MQSRKPNINGLPKEAGKPREIMKTQTQMLSTTIATTGEICRWLCRHIFRQTYIIRQSHHPVLRSCLQNRPVEALDRKTSRPSRYFFLYNPVPALDFISVSQRRCSRLPASKSTTRNAQRQQTSRPLLKVCLPLKSKTREKWSILQDLRPCNSRHPRMDFPLFPGVLG